MKFIIINTKDNQQNFVYTGNEIVYKSEKEGFAINASKANVITTEITLKNQVMEHVCLCQIISPTRVNQKVFSIAIEIQQNINNIISFLNLISF